MNTNYATKTAPDIPSFSSPEPEPNPMRHTLLRRAALVFLIAAAGCSAADAGDSGSSVSDLSGSDNEGAAAFRNVDESLEREATELNSTSTQAVQIDARTTGKTIASIVPAKNLTTAAAQGATPRGLEGVYWMRGNPLADYLLSFANMHWTDGNGTPYGYLSISAPGSVAFKRKVVARGAADGDFTFLPDICRVPREDKTLRRIAESPSTHDPNNFRRPIAEDFEIITSHRETGKDPRAEQFITNNQIAGQLAVDGPQLLATAHDTHAFYESRWNSQFTTSSVQVVFVATAPGLLRTIFPPIRLPVPEYLASFSLAPHLDGDPDVFVRKTFIVGSKSPNYYFLTRIVDGNGKELPHFKEFLQCVQERSGGELLKVLSPQPKAPSSTPQQQDNGGGGG